VKTVYDLAPNIGRKTCLEEANSFAGRMREAQQRKDEDAARYYAAWAKFYGQLAWHRR